MAFYVKVTEATAKGLNLTADRNRTADGNYLLWQQDLQSQPGATIFERAAAVGGVALDPRAAKAETDGVENPSEVFTPDKYKYLEINIPTKESSQEDEKSDSIVDETELDNDLIDNKEVENE